MPASRITPVTVLTGFLGSGKTTLLNHVLRDPAFADTAVLVNEYGEAAIDHALVRESSENVVLLPSGCICCQVAGDLVQALRELHFKRAAGEIPDFRRAIIETTGLADPAPLLRTLIEMPLVAARYALSGVIATVDAQHGGGTLDRHAEALRQVAMADRLALTKTDLVSPGEADALEARLASLNPMALRLRAVKGEIDAAAIFDVGLHRPGGGAPDVSGWLGEGRWRSFASVAPSGHDARLRSLTWRHEEPLELDALEAALDTLLELRGERILRMKGLANVGGTQPVALHAVQHVLYPPARLAAWPDADRATRLSFITIDLDTAPVAQILDAFLPRKPCSPPPKKTSSPSPS